MSPLLASCLINAQPVSGTPSCRRRQLLDWLHKPRADGWLVSSQYAFRWQPVRISVLFWVRSFIKLDLFDPNVPFDNTTQYLINLPWKLWLGLGLNLKLYYFSIFHGE